MPAMPLPGGGPAGLDRVSGSAEQRSGGWWESFGFCRWTASMALMGVRQRSALSCRATSRAASRLAMGG